MKRVLVIFFVAAIVSLHAGTANSASVKTIRLEQYGVELTLPERWSLEDTTDEYRPDSEDEEGQILFAEDDRDRADIGLFAVKAKEDQSIDEWAQSRIPWYMAKYAERSGYETVGLEYAEVAIAPGTTAVILYYRVNLILPLERKRSVAFVYFEHAGYYFFMTVYNRRFAPLEWEVEPTILPGIKLFKPDFEQ